MLEYLCNRIKDAPVTTVAGILLVSVPGYIICKEYIVPTIKHGGCQGYNVICSGTNVIKEEDVLESKVKSENLRSGPAFLNHHTYHGRRTDRVKSAYNSVCNLVNQNLDSGNKTFNVAVEEDDPIILNVTKRLLIDELDKDGYSAMVSIHELDPLDDIKVTRQSSDENEDKTTYYFSVTIV